MSIKGHNDNQYTKEKDAVERYLLRIIQRYFDIEKNFTKESTEAIILEALKRFKQHIASQTGYIFALNGLTGDITLTIQDFGGEPMIDKQTAFNKDFGDIADTVCEGNDPRLYDARIPLEHVQTIDDIKGLREELTKIVWPTSGFAHSHANQEILDALVYTGRQAQIDLIALEQLEKAVIDHCNKFSTYNQELVVIKRNGLAYLQEYIANISKIVVNAKEFTENAITWLSDAQAYTDANVSTWKNEMLKRILSLVTQSRAQNVIEALKNGYMLLDSGEFTFQSGIVSLVSIGDESDGYTNINETSKASYNISLNKYKNGRVKLYFKYDKDNETITTPLPFHFKTDAFDVIVQDTQDDDGKIIITCNLLSKFSVYATEDNKYDANTIIAADSVNIDAFYALQYRANQEDFKLCKIDSTTKNTFVSKLLKQDTSYLIDGQRSYIDGKYYDSEGNVIQYLNWDSEHPIEDDIHSNIATVNGKWQSVDGSEPFAFVAEYKIHKLTKEFDNPRIYYEVLGTEEVV